MAESETIEALRRAAGRAGFHLVKAGVETLKAIEVFVDELARVGERESDSAPDKRPRRVRIDVE